VLNLKPSAVGDGLSTVGQPVVMRDISLVMAIAVSFLLAPQAIAARVHNKHHVSRHWHGYGFLPGVRTPEQIESARAKHYWASGPWYYGPASPRFYHGRWNGGGFGPCYTQTPIGPMWNCGR